MNAAEVDQLRGERIGIVARLDGDRRARIERATTDDSIVTRLGERPAFGTARERWEDAASRLAQHHEAFAAEVPKRAASSLEETACTTSARAATTRFPARTMASFAQEGLAREAWMSPAWRGFWQTP